jgi:hypothetical protein
MAVMGVKGKDNRMSGLTWWWHPECWPWPGDRVVPGRSTSFCRHGLYAPVGLRAVGNPILMKFADTMLGTEAIHAQQLPVEAVAAVCEISG